MCGLAIQRRWRRMKIRRLLRPTVGCGTRGPALYYPGVVLRRYALLRRYRLWNIKRESKH